VSCGLGGVETVYRLVLQLQVASERKLWVVCDAEAKQDEQVCLCSKQRGTLVWREAGERGDEKRKWSVVDERTEGINNNWRSYLLAGSW
jgi:hypothetical protein